MADHAFEKWARPRGLVRKNPVHGNEEADIPLEMQWTKLSETGNRVGFASKFSMDVLWTDMNGWITSWCSRTCSCVRLAPNKVYAA